MRRVRNSEDGKQLLPSNFTPHGKPMKSERALKENFRTGNAVPSPSSFRGPRSFFEFRAAAGCQPEPL